MPIDLTREQLDWGFKRHSDINLDKYKGYVEDPDGLIRVRPENLEETASQNQGALREMRNGFIKMGSTALGTFVDGTLGTVVGAGNAIAQGSLEGFIDNPLSLAINSMMDEMETVAPNFYSNDERTSEWYQNILTGNFWGDKFFKNTGFAIGAIGASLVGGKVMGKALKIPQLHAQVGKDLYAAELINSVGIKGAIESGKLSKEMLTVASQIKNRGLATSIVSSMLGAQGEARMEAIGNSKQFKDKLVQENESIKQQLEVNNFRLSYISDEAERDFLVRQNEELQSKLVNDDDIAGMTTAYGNSVFALNFGVLSLSNALQFGKYLNPSFNKAKALSNRLVKEGGQYSAVNFTKKEIAFDAIKNAIPEGIEEQTQLAIEKGMDFYAKKFNKGQSGEVSDMVAAMGKGMAEAYGNFSNYENFFLGALTGLSGVPTISKGKLTLAGGIKDAITDARETNLTAEKAASDINEVLNSDRFKNNYQGLVRSLTLEKEKVEALQNKDAFTYKNAELQQFVNDVLTFQNAGKEYEMTERLDEIMKASPDDIRSANLIPVLDSEGKPRTEYVGNKLKDEEKAALTEIRSAKSLEQITPQSLSSLEVLTGKTYKPEELDLMKSDAELVWKQNENFKPITKDSYEGISDEDIISNNQKKVVELKNKLEKIKQIQEAVDIKYPGITKEAKEQITYYSLVADDTDKRIEQLNGKLLSFTQDNKFVAADTPLKIQEFLDVDPVFRKVAPQLMEAKTVEEIGKITEDNFSKSPIYSEYKKIIESLGEESLDAVKAITYGSFNKEKYISNYADAVSKLATDNPLYSEEIMDAGKDLVKLIEQRANYYKLLKQFDPRQTEEIANRISNKLQRDADEEFYNDEFVDNWINNSIEALGGKAMTWRIIRYTPVGTTKPRYGYGFSKENKRYIKTTKGTIPFDREFIENNNPQLLTLDEGKAVVNYFKARRNKAAQVRAFRSLSVIKEDELLKSMIRLDDVSAEIDLYADEIQTLEQTYAQIAEERKSKRGPKPKTMLSLVNKIEEYKKELELLQKERDTLKQDVTSLDGVIDYLKKETEFLNSINDTTLITDSLYNVFKKKILTEKVGEEVVSSEPIDFLVKEWERRLSLSDSLSNGLSTVETKIAEVEKGIKDYEVLDGIYKGIKALRVEAQNADEFIAMLKIRANGENPEVDKIIRRYISKISTSKNKFNELLSLREELPILQEEKDALKKQIAENIQAIKLLEKSIENYEQFEDLEKRQQIFNSIKKELRNLFSATQKRNTLDFQAKEIANQADPSRTYQDDTQEDIEGQFRQSAAKSSPNTQAANHVEFEVTENKNGIQKYKSKRNQDGSLMINPKYDNWFKAVNKLNLNKDQYSFRFFNVANDELELFTEEDKKWPDMIKVVITDSKGNALKFNNVGEISSTGDILTVPIHDVKEKNGKPDNFIARWDERGFYKTSLNEVALIDKYLKSIGVAGNFTKEEAKSIIKSDKYTLPDGSIITWQQLKSEAIIDAYNKFKDLRDTITQTLNSNVSVYAKIKRKSSGIINRLPAVDGKTRKNNLLGSFVSSTKEIGKVFVAKDNFHVSSSGVRFNTSPGRVYVERNDGQLVDVYTDKLNNSESELVIELLNWVSNAKDGKTFKQNQTLEVDLENSVGVTEDDLDFIKGHGQNKIFFSLANKNNKFLLSKLVYYGKQKEDSANKKHEFYLSIENGFVVYGGEKVLPVELLNKEDSYPRQEFKDFLLNKLFQVNTHLLDENKNTPYYHPIKFSSGKIAYKKYFPADGLSGYEMFLLKDKLKTDIVSLKSNEPQYLNQYLEFDDTKISSKPFEKPEETETKNVVIKTIPKKEVKKEVSNEEEEFGLEPSDNTLSQFGVDFNPFDPQVMNKVKEAVEKRKPERDAEGRIIVKEDSLMETDTELQKRIEERKKNNPFAVKKTSPPTKNRLAGEIQAYYSNLSINSRKEFDKFIENTNFTEPSKVIDAFEQKLRCG